MKATNSNGTATATSAETGSVTWSTHTFAAVTLAASKTTSPGMTLTVPPLGTGLDLQRLTIKQPKGISFRATSLAQGLTLQSSSHKRLRFTAALRHGVLTIVLVKPAGGIKLALARGLLRTVGALSSRTAMALTLQYAGKPAWRGTVKVRMA